MSIVDLWVEKVLNMEKRLDEVPLRLREKVAVQVEILRGKSSD